MPVSPYDPSSNGPSQAALVDTTAYTNQIQDSANRSDLTTQQGRLTNDYNSNVKPALMSSLGASGQVYSTAGANAEAQTKTGYENQMGDLQTAFDRAHMDLKRQEAFAAIGLII